MKPAKQISLDFFGAKKRIGDIKQIVRGIEKQYRLTHTALISTPNCVTYFYSWGHICIYTYPKAGMMLVTIFSSMCYLKTEALKNAVIEIFAPAHYEIQEITRSVV